MDKNGVFRYYFDDKRATIIRKEKIVPFDSTFNIPTTFTIFDPHLYFIINTQIDNINEETNQIIDTQKLESYILMKKKIK